MNRNLQVGDRASITRVYTQDEVNQYVKQSEEMDSDCYDVEQIVNAQNEQPIVHGLLVDSLFSVLLEQHLPGKGSIYLGKTLKFKTPIYCNMKITSTVEIVEIRKSESIVLLRTTSVGDKGELLVTGKALVLVPWIKRMLH